MSLYLVYLIAGLCLVFFDVFLVTLFLLPVGLALLATSLAAFYIDMIFLHGVVFVLGSILFLYLFQGLLKKKAGMTQPKVGVEGEKGYVVEVYKGHEHPCKVRVYDDIYEVYQVDHGHLHSLKIDDDVIITDMVGNKVIVKHSRKET